MRRQVNVTEVQRNFSDFLNRVGYRDESFILVRGGRPVAELSPVPLGLHLGDLPGLLAALPPPGKEGAEEEGVPGNAGEADPAGEEGEPDAARESAEGQDSGGGRLRGGVLLHHSVLFSWAHRPDELKPRISGREEVPFHLSVITVGEMLREARQVPDPVLRARGTAFVETVADTFPLLPGDLATARSHAELWGRLAQGGVRLGPHDLWLLAAATAHGLTLATAIPERLQGLPSGMVEDWSPGGTGFPSGAVATRASGQG